MSQQWEAGDREMNGRIYNCHHLIPERILSTSLFSTMVSGARDDDRTGLVGDLGGCNISYPNWYSEMRHQYHVWQERLSCADYVGFEHYRRMFFINPLSATRMRRYHPDLLDEMLWFASDECWGALPLDEAQFESHLRLREGFDDEIKHFVDRLMTDNDIVTPRPQPIRLDEQFRESHSPAEWDIFREIVKDTRFFVRSSSLVDFSLRSSFFCNMYIMRTEFFLEYMEFWWETIRALEPLIEKRERVFGFFSERLVNLFVNGKRLQEPCLRTRALPFVFDRRPPAR